MDIRQFFLSVVALFFFSLCSFHQAFADTLVLQSDGKVLFTTDTGQIKYFLFSHEKFTNPHVLGASSGVVITVSLSSFIPTDTPVPTTHPTPTRTLSANNKSSPTSKPTPTPTNTPTIPTATPTSIPKSSRRASSNASSIHTPNPAAKLIATITTPSKTTTQEVNKVTQQAANGDTLTLTPNTQGDAIVITQGNTQATTTLPVQLNSDLTALHTVIQDKTYPIVAPKKAIQTIASVGSYLIPATIKINLTAVNNLPIYDITGKQHVQIFGLFIIDSPITIDVTADGKIQQVKNPFLLNLLEFLHIGKRVIR